MMVDLIERVGSMSNYRLRTLMLNTELVKHIVGKTQRGFDSDAEYVTSTVLLVDGSTYEVEGSPMAIGTRINLMTDNG